MNPTYLKEINETEVSLLVCEEAPLEFATFMHEEPRQNPEEDDDEDIPETLLMDGPVFAPMIPPLMTFQVSRLVATLPIELQPVIEPLYAEIQTAFKSGIVQTKMVIELPSLEKVEVVIDQYDTDQTAFHISFYSTEQTAELISQKQNALLNVLQTALPNFSFAISPPFLAAPSFSLPKTKRFGYSPVNKAKSKK